MYPEITQLSYIVDIPESGIKDRIIYNLNLTIGDVSEPEITQGVIESVLESEAPNAKLETNESNKGFLVNIELTEYDCWPKRLENNLADFLECLGDSIGIGRKIAKIRDGFVELYNFGDKNLDVQSNEDNPIKDFYIDTYLKCLMVRLELEKKLETAEQIDIHPEMIMPSSRTDQRLIEKLNQLQNRIKGLEAIMLVRRNTRNKN